MNIVDEPDSCRKLPCGHCYHTICIRQWIVQGNPKCPVCNSDIFVDGDNPFQAGRNEDEQDDDAIPDFHEIDEQIAREA